MDHFFNRKNYDCLCDGHSFLRGDISGCWLKNLLTEHAMTQFETGGFKTQKWHN